MVTVSASDKKRKGNGVFQGITIAKIRRITKRTAVTTTTTTIAI